ncbi:MAG TPA: hypothetical protein VNT79_07735 [Phycisphaerae bacterium]|nr:hypothetical protein [Phycisphaerae bacterium]
MNRCVLAKCLIAGTVAWTAAVARGQSTAPSSMPVDESIDHGMKLLAGVRDHVYSFDDPAFYWFCRFVRQDADDQRYRPGPAAPPISWRFLMERPSDYRGTLVTVEGRLLRREAFEVPNREGVGRLFQCEIGDAATRAVCTAILTEDPGDTSSTIVRLRGYFIKVRAFQTTDGQPGAGPLIVSKFLQRPDAHAAIPRESVAITALPAMTKWIGLGTAVLIVLWIVLRRAAHRSVSRRNLPLARHGPDAAESDADFDWLTPSGKKDQSA